MQRRAPFLRSLLARGALALSLLGVLSPAGLRAADGENQPDWSTFEDGHKEVAICEAVLDSSRKQAWVDVAY